MNAEQMRSALLTFADLIGGGAGSHRSGSLNQLSALFEGLGKTKVSAIVTKIGGNWKSSNRVPRYPPELKDVVGGIQRALESTGARTQANAFGILLKLFAGAGDQPVDAFVAEAIAARVKASRPPRTAGTRTPFTTEKARMLAEQLASAADDRKRFDTLLEELKGQLKVKELKTIAGFYTGYETIETKKDSIVRAIRHWHRQDELNRDRRASQAKTTL